MKPTWQDETAGVYLFRADAEAVLPSLDGVSAVLTDPPYGLAPRKKGGGSSRGGPSAGLLGLEWDRDVPPAELWQAVLGCCLPGAPLMSFGGCRTYHRLAGRIEQAGWTVCNQLFWLFGSGFPKGSAVDKLLDKSRNDRELVLEITAAIRKYRDAAGMTNADIDRAFGFRGMAGHWCSAGSQPAVPAPGHWERLRHLIAAPRWVDRLVRRANRLKGTDGRDYQDRPVVAEHSGGAEVFAEDAGGWQREYQETAPGSAESAAWHGWRCGMSALKPAAEPICYAEAPLDGTYPENARRHGVAGLWIDGARVPTGDKLSGSGQPPLRFGGDNARPFHADHQPTRSSGHAGGRYPANVVHDGSPDVVAEFERAGASRSRRAVKRRAASDGFGGFGPQPAAERGFDDAGSPARFFYCAKPSAAEKTAGGRVKNTHRTVKPVALMRWLCRLTTQAGRKDGGVVLDPFLGSGTTAVAAVECGRPVVGIERDADSFRVARERVKRALADRRAAAPAEARAA